MSKPQAIGDWLDKMIALKGYDGVLNHVGMVEYNVSHVVMDGFVVVTTGQPRLRTVLFQDMAFRRNDKTTRDRDDGANRV